MTWLAVGTFRVETDALEACVAGLGRTEAELERLGDDLARRLAVLHEDWHGDAALAHATAQQRWEASLRRLQEALADVRRAARHAHRSYEAAVEASRRMWAQLA